jgi:hypothetical protein
MYGEDKMKRYGKNDTLKQSLRVESHTFMSMNSTRVRREAWNRFSPSESSEEINPVDTLTVDCQPPEL